MEITNISGKQIRELRSKSRLTASVLAKALAVPLFTLGNWEAGRCNPPEDMTAEKITDAIRNLVEARKVIKETAKEVGWPEAVL